MGNSGMIVGAFSSVSGKADTVLTTKGDLATYSTTRIREAVGTNNYTLMADSAQATGIKWAASATSVLTTAGDLLVASGANTLSRLARGSDNQTLMMDGTSLNWETVSASGGNFGNFADYTISSGIITTTTKCIEIDTEGGAGTDDLDAIAGGTEGDILIAKSENTARDPTFVDTGAGSINKMILAGNFTLDSKNDSITLIARENAGEEFVWYEISRSNNASWGWKCPNYVAYFSDDNENNIIKRMEQNYKCIVPAVSCNVNDHTKLDLKYFDGSTLVTIPKSKFGLHEQVLYNKLRRISQKHLKKHIIQNSSKSAKQKEKEINKFM